MIGWPLIENLILSTSASTPPRNAPTMPATRSPKRPRPWPRATRLASAPATRPTRIQMSTVSRSRRMSITSLTPFLKETAQRWRSCGFGGQVLQHCAQDPVEGRERVDDVRESLQGGAGPQGEHDLAEDLARARGHHRCPDQHAAVAVADQLHGAAVEVVDVAARRLGGVCRCGDDADPAFSRGGL